MSSSLASTAKQRITQLIEEYQDLVAKGEELKYNEEEVKIKFILPFLEALGWKIKTDVKPEKRTLMGITDLSLKATTYGTPDIFYEIKSFKEDLDGHRFVAGKRQTYTMQAINASFSARVDWCVLTNFKELRLYYSKVKKPKDGLQFKLKFSDYVTDRGFGKLWDLSKERIKEGILETYRKRRTREDVNTEFVNDLYSIRKSLTGNINKNNELSKEALRESVQKIIDRFVVIRVAEDRGVIHTDSLSRMVEVWNETSINKSFRTLMHDLKNLFRDFDFSYNTKLFDKHPCEDLTIENEFIEMAIRTLYTYNFDLIDADILGAMYEDYIGHILEEKKADLDIVEDYSTRKKSGIYYTPTSIVEYISKNTVGKLITDWKTPDKIDNLRVLDPACGSGSFLIKAYDSIKRFYDVYNFGVKENLKNEGKVTLSHYEDIIPNVETRIVDNNLFAVDIDPQATEIATVNLMLKALTRGEKLPLILGKNIKFGNSLVSDPQTDEDAFNWNEEFPEIMKDGGFDIIIGNPPWGADLSKESNYLESEYDLAKGQYDSYELFIELSKKILKKGGIWGFVIPDSVFYPEHEKLRKFLSTKMKILKIAKLGEGFFDVFRSSAVIIFKNEKPEKEHMLKALVVMKEDRKKVLEGMIDLSKLEEERAVLIPQKRFAENEGYAFDITRSIEDDEIMQIMEHNIVDWEELTDSSRGVEFSGSGLVIQCPNCFRWDNPPRKRKGKYIPKVCSHCNHEYKYEEALAIETIVAEDRPNDKYVPFISGLGVNRYYLDHKQYLDVTKEGINYKDLALYEKPKLLVRKTGVGIYATIDYANHYVPQVVYIFKIRDELPEEYKNYRIEYILGVINSRLMLYYYYKKFGELEWKSFPYVTQKTIKQLPLRKIDFSKPEQKQLHDGIVQKVTELIEKTKNGEVPREIDYQVEDLVMQLYGITPKMKNHIWNELRKVQKLRIIRDTMG